MTKLALLVSAALVLPAVATAAPLREPGPPNTSGGSRGYVLSPPAGNADDGTADNHAPTSHIIYLNRCVGGCVFTKGSINDAITNTTQLGPGPLGGTFTLSAFAQSETVWTDFVQCMREVYAPFDVQIVTDDPGNVPHHEAVVAGTSQEYGRPDILGQAVLDPTICAPKNNVISFSLANSHAASGQQLCWTAAQETAHSYGLDHAFECTDPMTYIGDDCGQKYFRNKLVPCGTAGPTMCLCSGTSQNSHVKLLSVHGANPVPPPAPTMAITSPVNGATVTGLFSTIVSATDKRGIGRLELYINGWKWAEVPGGRNTQYLVSVPAGVPDGVMDVRVNVCNDIDRCSEQTVTVTRGAACTSAAACLTGQKCEAGKCFWDPPTGALGDACTYDQQCLNERCQALSDGSQICTEDCFGGPNDECDDGFSCSGAIGQAGVCVPKTEEGGCCSTGGAGTGGALAINLGLGALVGLLIVRRRRQRA